MVFGVLCPVSYQGLYQGQSMEEKPHASGKYLWHFNQVWKTLKRSNISKGQKSNSLLLPQGTYRVNQSLPWAKSDFFFPLMQSKVLKTNWENKSMFNFFNKVVCIRKRLIPSLKYVLKLRPAYCTRPSVLVCNNYTKCELRSQLNENIELSVW